MDGELNAKWLYLALDSLELWTVFPLILFVREMNAKLFYLPINLPSLGTLAFMRLPPHSLCVLPC